ncbi:MAG: elongation factor G [Oscillospiraceae bacterium]|jgi:elongation factor G|nr:elongation factor G [Oscillospiraceae bacterium]
MKTYKCENIRNITLAGHGGSGKTTFAEALIFKSGGSDRMGRVTDGNTVTDYDPEEIKRKISLNTSLAYAEWKNTKINIVDTPGQFDFIGGMYEGVRAAETVIICVPAKDGVQVGTIKAYKEAVKQGKAKIFVITKNDEENADFTKTLETLKSQFGGAVCELSDRDSLSELIAETDEELMDKFLDAGEFTDEEFSKGLKVGLAKGDITPVISVTATSGDGIEDFLNLIVTALPAPCDVDGEKSGDTKIKYDEKAPLAAYVFKTLADPFVGKLSFVKIITGSLGAKTEPTNSRTGEVERFGKIIALRGKKQEELTEAFAGDIIAITKLDATTGDTLCDASKVVDFAVAEFPVPCFFQAVAAKGKGDEGKISNALVRMIEEDPTLSYVNNTETRQRVLGGLGDQHLDVAVNKMKSKFGVEVELSEPVIAYRETIRKKVVNIEGKHKKQSGGAGQFGVVIMEFEPHPEDELIFEERVFGGSVPKQFFPAVEKGLRESVEHGVLAGYPVVRLKATLVDGKYHPVDSKEIAFVQAARLAFKEGMKEASPCLLEPILSLKILVGDENTGDVMGIVNKRRGSVLGTSPVGDGMTEVVAEMPQAETTDFALVILQMTKGLGSYTMEFARYQELPQMLEAEVIAKAPKVKHEV